MYPLVYLSILRTKNFSICPLPHASLLQPFNCIRRNIMRATDNEDLRVDILIVAAYVSIFLILWGLYRYINS